MLFINVGLFFFVFVGGVYFDCFYLFFLDLGMVFGFGWIDVYIVLFVLIIMLVFMVLVGFSLLILVIWEVL